MLKESAKIFSTAVKDQKGEMLRTSQNKDQAEAERDAPSGD